MFEFCKFRARHFDARHFDVVYFVARHFDARHYDARPSPRFECGTLRLRIGGSTNRLLGQLIITILHSVYRFKHKMAFSSDYFNNKNNVCEMKFLRNDTYPFVLIKSINERFEQ